MASGIAGLEDEWEEAYHSKWSTFERLQVCKINTRDTFGKMARSFGHMHYGGGGGGGNQPDACCGEEGEK